MDDRQRSTAGQEDGRNRRDQLDDFWDIGRLVPARPAGRRPQRPPVTPTTVEVELPSRGGSASQAVGAVPFTVSPEQPTAREEQRPTAETVPVGTGPLPGAALGTTHYVPPHTATDGMGVSPELTYAPDGILIHRVEVYPWRSNYHYFDRFGEDAVRYDAMKPPAGRDARREPFFSFFPQYAQLDRRQTVWYLTWRETVRGGDFPETDYAYVLLYIFELINLPVDHNARHTAGYVLDRLVDVWIAYRKAHPQLDHYLCQWVRDYCLIHQLPPPMDRLRKTVNDCLDMCHLKEFYLNTASPGPGEPQALAQAGLLLRHCCQYDYHKSKFAAGVYGPLFDRIIPGGVAAVMPILLGTDGQRPLWQTQASTMTIDAYDGALCAYCNKRRIVVTYTSFSRSHELRFLVGDIVKHLENRLRGWIGVRSRLSVMALPPSVRDALDAYLAPLSPASPAVLPKKPVPRPAYESMYDLPHKAVSLADADAIEQDSWATTRILTEAFEGSERPEEAESAGASVTEPATEPDESISIHVPEGGDEGCQSSAPPDSPLAQTLGADLCAFVRLALDGDGPGQRAFARAHHTMPDALADRVNSITTEQEIFDMILDDAGDGTYVVLDDYRNMVRTWLGDAE